MISQSASYDAPAVYLPRLIAWADQQRAALEAAGASLRAEGNLYYATKAGQEAGRYAAGAERLRERLIREHELTLADVQAQEASEPPRTLVGLTDWLVTMLGRWFPGLPREGWQAIACALHTWRPQP